jgi:putative membrane protein
MHRFRHPWIYGHPWGDGHPWGNEHQLGNGFGLGPGMILSALSTLFLVALFIGLVWALLGWIIPTIRPMLTDIFGQTSTEPSALEILRQRYAAGEIDTYTFEQMRERLVASYQQESNGRPLDDYSYQEENWTGYRNIDAFPPSYGQGKVRMAEQEQYTSETDM